MNHYSDFSLKDFENENLVMKYVQMFNLQSAYVSSIPDTNHPVYDLKKSSSVDPNNTIPFSPVWQDLARIHWITRIRQVSVATEFGSGWTTSVIAHALWMNKLEFNEQVLVTRRALDPFTLTSVDESQEWSDLTLSRTRLDLHQHIKPIVSEVVMGTFQGRACTFYSDLPNVVSDLVLVDGPSQFAPKNTLRGFSTNLPNLMPMQGDLLTLEHFFEPGALIVVDGRSANSRFIKSNLQRPWVHRYFEQQQFHLFELQELALGPVNEERLGRLKPRFLLT